MSDIEDEEELPEDELAIEGAAFGAANRRRILNGYFLGVGEVSPAEAWKHVYRLLLWINPTISLVHCYESDKCQPHKAWYPRSLAFHRWVSEQFGVSPAELHEQIDHLFREALPALARVEVSARRFAAAKHLKPYADLSMPLPGDDAELVELVGQALGFNENLLKEAQQRALVEQVYTHFARENKRKNLLGRGFEDTLAALIDQVPGHENWTVATRATLSEIPGFVPQAEHLKRTEVDLVLWESKPNGRRILVSSKWSVRADRERQFESDIEDYIKANVGGPFEYSLVTNEFDAARLDAACTKVRGHQHLLTNVVHVQPEGVLVAYGLDTDPPSQAARGKSLLLRTHIESGRLVSFGQWLIDILGQ